VAILIFAGSAPYYFGDEFQKTTCLWLKGLPPLTHSASSDLFQERTHVGRGEFVTFASGKRMAKWYAELRASDKRGHIRSKTFPGIAEAMAAQWGSLALGIVAEIPQAERRGIEADSPVPS
jgi:hypothetical protein